MYIVKLLKIERIYKIHGQHAEQVAKYTLTGKIEKADNKPFYVGGDCGDLQIKSNKATICPGRDFKAHIEKDPAKKYGYVNMDCTKMYVMTKTEYTEFVEMFGCFTTESKKNGGNEKTRLKYESKKMVDYLEKRVG